MRFTTTLISIHLAACGTDPNACGAAGTHSRLEGDHCVCEPGTTWLDPSGGSYICVPLALCLCDSDSNCTAGCACDPDCPPPCTCDTTDACDTGCVCDDDCSTCACDTSSACETGCACDEDCPPPCTCDTSSACEAGCACDEDCPPPCTCDTSSACETGCACDPDCCTCDATPQCTPGCACDLDCTTCACDTTAGCESGCACDLDCQCTCDVDAQCTSGCTCDLDCVACACNVTSACDPACTCDGDCTGCDFVSVCQSGDDCCPSGCGPSSDDDCGAMTPTEHVDGYGTIGKYSSLRFDSNGVRWLAYADPLRGGSSYLKVARWQSDSWEIDIVDQTGFVGEDVSLALDALGQPRVSYYDLSHRALKYAAKVGGTWRIETVDGIDEVGQHSSIAVDATGAAHISYWDYSNADLKYAVQTGSGWAITTVDADGRVGTHTSIAVDSSGTPHISYYDITNRDLRYARKNGSVWHLEMVASEYDVGRFSALALDSAGEPHIAFHDDTYGDLEWARHTPGGWIVETVDSYGDTGLDIGFVLDASDNPHFSYRNDSQDVIKYAHRVDGVFYKPTVAEVYDFRDENCTSLALDANGAPHIAFDDTTELAYATLVGSDWALDVVDERPTVYSGGALVLHDGVPHVAYGADDGIWYGYWAGDRWARLEVTESAYGSYRTALAIDDDGLVYVAYSKPFDGVMLARLVDGEWQVEVVTEGSNPSMVLDSLGRPRICSSAGPLSYARWNGSTWDVEEIDSWGANCSLVLDDDEVPHVSFSSSSSSDPLTWNYGNRIGGQWHTEVFDTDESNLHVGQRSSLALGPDGAPHVAYCHWDEYSLRYARKSGTGWAVETIDDPEYAGAGQYPSLVVDGSGTPHIAYQSDYSLTYATLNGTWQIEMKDWGDFGYDENGVDNTLVMTSDGRLHVAYVDDRSMALRYQVW